MVIFLDTYAIIEIALDNPSYRKYALESTKAITTIFNLMEVHFYYLKRHGQKEANAVYSIVKGMVIRIDDSIVKEANMFKIKHLKKRFGFADSIGYITARKYDAKFLTGDYMFKGMEGVEFAK
jgi:predicted nucleic acid-binding protein